MSYGYSNEDLETFITPSLFEDLPELHLPGDVKYSSFKTTFQQFCQKRHLTIPTYKIRMKGNGFTGSVSFSLNYACCHNICATVKEAEQRIAFDTLQLIGYMKDVKYETVSHSSKRKSNFIGPQVPKQIKVEERQEEHIADVVVDTSLSPKSQLNIIAQKKRLPMPVYSIVLEADGYASIVQFANKIFRSKACEKRKEAEQEAAKVCIMYFKGELSQNSEATETQ